MSPENFMEEHLH